MKRERDNTVEDKRQVKREKCQHESVALIKKHYSEHKMPLTDSWWNRHSQINSDVLAVWRNRDLTRHIMSYFVNDMSSFAAVFTPYHLNSNAQIEALCGAFAKDHLMRVDFTQANSLSRISRHPLSDILFAISNDPQTRADGMAYTSLISDTLQPLIQYAFFTSHFPEKGPFRCAT